MKQVALRFTILASLELIFKYLSWTDLAPLATASQVIFIGMSADIKELKPAVELVYRMFTYSRVQHYLKSLERNALGAL